MWCELSEQNVVLKNCIMLKGIQSALRSSRQLTYLLKLCYVFFQQSFTLHKTPQENWTLHSTWGS